MAFSSKENNKLNFRPNMDEPQPGPSNVQIPLIQHDQATSEDDSDSIKYADSPETPPAADTSNFNKASIAAAQQQLHDGIILLITSDTESQRSPNGSIVQHPLSEYYLLPLPQDASGANRRYSLQEKNKQYHPERKASCPDAELGLSPDRNPHRRSSELDIAKDRLTPTSFSSRRSSNASACHSRRSSNCSLHHHHHHRRPSNCSRRSSNSSRRSSTASHKSSNCSRRSSNCSRRSSHYDSDEDNSFLHQHSHHHSHNHSHRGSRCSLDPIPHRASEEVRRGSHYRVKDEEELDEEREELEMGGIPPRHRKIIIWIIGSVSIFILLMSVVLIAVSLTMSPTIDDLECFNNCFPENDASLLVKRTCSQRLLKKIVALWKVIFVYVIDIESIACFLLFKKCRRHTNQENNQAMNMENT